MAEQEASKGESEKAEAPQAPEPVKTPEAFVRNGTTTSKSYEYYKRRFHEAEKRRDEQKREEADAVRVKGYSDKNKSDIASAEAINEATAKGTGTLFQNQFTRHPEIPKAYINLKYCDHNGNQVYWEGEAVEGQADLIVGLDPLKPHELSLIIVCPRCVQKGRDTGKHLQEAQITIRQSHVNFEFKPGLGPPTFVFQGRVYRSAGMIVESEKFRCSHDGWTARIVNNRVIPDR